MQDAGDGHGLAALGAPQSCVEMVEGAVAVVEGGMEFGAVRKRDDRLGRGMGLPGQERRQLGREFD